MIKYLSYYLPYGLKLQLLTTKGDPIVVPLLGIDFDFTEGNSTLVVKNEQGMRRTNLAEATDSYKPILRPFSHMVEEINVPCNLCTEDDVVVCSMHRYNKEIDGKLQGYNTITPIIEIAKLATTQKVIETEILNTGGYGVLMASSEGEFQFDIDKYWDMSIGCTFGTSEAEDNVVQNQLAIFQFLFQYHFDVFGLIEKGLAVSY